LKPKDLELCIKCDDLNLRINLYSPTNWSFNRPPRDNEPLYPHLVPFLPEVHLCDLLLMLISDCGVPIGAYVIGSIAGGGIASCSLE